MKIKFQNLKKLNSINFMWRQRFKIKTFNQKLPKPLIKIKNKSILENIIDYFKKYRINNFIVATGYKHQMIDDFISKKYKNLKLNFIFWS